MKPEVKQKAPISVSSTAALVRVARARLAEQTSDLRRARRELSLAADQLPLDHYLKAALKELLESP